MRTHVALLRGINVGGNNKVPMAGLRELMTSLGYTDVATYIQSGNVVFTAPGADSGKLAAELDEKITERFGVPGHVVVVTRDELAAVIEGNPYPEEPNPKAVHAVFRRTDLTPDDLERVETARQRAAGKGCRDEVTVAGRTLFLHTPDGLGRSELAAQLSRTSSMKAWHRAQLGHRDQADGDAGRLTVSWSVLRCGACGGVPGGSGSCHRDRPRRTACRAAGSNPGSSRSPGSVSCLPGPLCAARPNGGRGRS